MAKSGNILALDYGYRRIGLALASWAARLPAQLGYIDVEKAHSVIETIQKLIDENEVSHLVVGLARGLDGQETSQSQNCRNFAQSLGVFGLPIELQDEAGTSILAEEKLQVGKKPYTKGDIDSLAAVLILEDYLANKGTTDE